MLVSKLENLHTVHAENPPSPSLWPQPVYKEDPHFPLLSLPEGPIENILSYLSSLELLTFASCSSACLKYSKNDNLWKSLLHRDFKEEISAFPQSVSRTWRQCYHEACRDFIYNLQNSQFHCVWCGHDCEEEDGTYICNDCQCSFPVSERCKCGKSYRGCKGENCSLCEERICEGEDSNYYCGFCEERLCSNCFYNCQYCPRCGKICEGCTG